MPLTLLIPELIWPEPGDHERFTRLLCPALERLLARGRFTRHPVHSFEHALAGLFGQSGETPLAALRRLGESQPPGPDDAIWINADPVHLKLQQDRLILADSGGFSLAGEEAEELVATLNAELGESGRLHVGTAGRWYLECRDPALADGIGAAPLSAVAGRNIEAQLADALQSRALRRLTSELQMLLHAHPINRHREASGELPINSLWLWGAGRRPEHLAADYDKVIAGDALALGLARAAGIATTAPQTDGIATVDGKALFVRDDALVPVQYEDAEAYAEAIARLERECFAPLLDALLRGRLDRLRLLAPTVYGLLDWEVGRVDLLKFWRAPQPLGTWAERLKDQP